jgi:SAM-dependent methyltransferase
LADDDFPTEDHLLAAAISLGANEIAPWSDNELRIARSIDPDNHPSRSSVARLREMIRAGRDPLGEAFCRLRSPLLRRASGATYTPGVIVRAMADWAEGQVSPMRVVDPGCGSGRFLFETARRFPQAELHGVETDPTAAILCRANLAVLGLANRAQVHLSDFREFRLPDGAAGPTLFIGNPPYVRHHQIEPAWKDWFADEVARLGLRASKLAGLHVHFFVATLRASRPGDIGVFITAAEWLDVNYGSLLRNLLLDGLGGRSITLIDPVAMPFPDAATTAAITTFQIASRPRSISFQTIRTLDGLEKIGGGLRIGHERLATERRWSQLKKATAKVPQGFVELGEICRVHRGQVTGANAVWIAGPHSRELPPSVLYSSVTRAKEIFSAGGILADASRLRSVIDLPADLEMLDPATRRAVDRFLKFAHGQKADSAYIALHRKPWWSVRLKPAPPILATYMGRRPPEFALSRAAARHINIAHGLYPVATLSERAMQTLVAFLRTNISQGGGRTYAGGLTKFEPGEMERLIVPGPAMLEVGVSGG